MHAQIQKYDPIADSFSWATQLPPHVTDTWDACLVAADDKLYLLGGRQKLAEQYCPAAEQWSQLSQPPARYDYGGSFGVVHDGKLLLCGGKTGSNNRDLVEELDRTSQQWKTTDIKLPFAFYWGHSHVASISV